MAVGLPAPPSSAPWSVPAPLGDPVSKLIGEDLANARVLVAAGDYSGAVPVVERVLALDPENAEALDLKRQAAEATLRARPTGPKVADPLIDPSPPDPEASARVERLQGEVSAGKSRLEKKEFAAAIALFRSVRRKQPGYLALTRSSRTRSASSRTHSPRRLTVGTGTSRPTS